MMLFPWHTSDNVPFACQGVDSFQVFKITVKDQNWFLNAKSGLRALNNVSEMVPNTQPESSATV